MFISRNICFIFIIRKLTVAININLIFFVLIVKSAQNIQVDEKFYQEFQNHKNNTESTGSSKFNLFPSGFFGLQQTNMNTEEHFKIIWNVPTFQCHKYGLRFNQLSNWGIIQNYEGSFRGDKIALLYDPGFFPALLVANSHSDYIRRNGGVPQEGNLTEHLEIFSNQVVNKFILNEDFTGNAVIDFEHWRPIWEENFGSLASYRRVSRNIEEVLHPLWNFSEIENEASKRFEEAASLFFRTTLEVAKSLRPRALWGYYGFPLCFNYTPKNHHASCTETAMENNERLKWLYDESAAIYPSLYYKQYGMNEKTRALFMEGRISEAMRISSLSTPNPPVYSYTWFKYYDSKEFVSQIDLMNSLLIPKKSGAAGIVVWGASNDVSNKEKCEALNQYVETVLGPSVTFSLKVPKKNISIDYGDRISAQQSFDQFNNDLDYI